MARRSKAGGDVVIIGALIALVVAAFVGLFILLRQTFRWLSSSKHRARVNPLRVALARATALESDLSVSKLELQTVASALRQKEVEVDVARQERDRWRAVAESRANHTAPPPRAAPTSGVDKSNYSKLRAVVIKSLHPDHAGGSGLERAARGEMFKVIWPEIERIDGSR